MAPILAVDDERDLLTLYERLLRFMSLPVTTSSTDRDAMRQLDAGPVAPVISDLRLPDGNGVDVIRRTRTLPGRVPSILVTGAGWETAAATAATAGADRFLVKPFNLMDLAASIKELTAREVGVICA